MTIGVRVGILAEATDLDGGDLFQCGSPLITLPIFLSGRDNGHHQNDPVAKPDEDIEKLMHHLIASTEGDKVKSPNASLAMEIGQVAE